MPTKPAPAPGGPQEPVVQTTSRRESWSARAPGGAGGTDQGNGATVPGSGMPKVTSALLKAPRT
eukprot:11162577-Lingulodinium_polyedra.AAC.1